MPEPESPLVPDDTIATNGHHPHDNPASANGVDIRYHLTAYAQSETWLPGGLSILARYRHALLWEQILGLAAEIGIYPLEVERAVDAWLAAHPQHNGKAFAGKDTPMVTTLAEVMPTPIAWLWNPYIPLGKITILEGDPEVGKTWLSLVIAASITRGLPLPSPENIPQLPGAPGAVVLMQGEDGIADTLRPRFDTVGGDPERLHLLQGKRVKGGDRVQDISLQDMDIIEATLAQFRPLLLIIDPLQAYLGANVDMHRANQTRPLLSALGRLAEAHQCSVLCIRHLSKSRHNRLLYRGLGSIDFAAAARSVLLAGFDPDDPQEKRRVLAHNKSGLTLRGTSLGYEISDTGFHWRGPSTITPAQLLAPYRSEEARSELEEAMDFLRDLLSVGPQTAQDIYREAKKEGISIITLKRAKKQLSVESSRENFSASSQGRGRWRWHLQGDQPTHSQGTSTISASDDPLENS